VIASVGGDTALRSGDIGADARADQWRAGRTIEAPMTFRRPARFLNDGVPDFERDLALDGVTLLASVKSGLLVDVIEQGSPLSEAAAGVRAHVRRAIARWVAPHDPLSAAIATAVLIGDRGGLPDETRELLQAAGTYHVIAISGGNIAILAAVVTGLFALCGIRGRGAAVPAIVLLTLYALVATSGPSVWRATLMALLYFGARAIDHRVPVWHASAVAAALMVVIQPLDVRDPGFVLTFGATAALIEGARHGVALTPRHPALSWIVASVFSSLAVEAALLPVSAQMFSACHRRWIAVEPAGRADDRRNPDRRARDRHLRSRRVGGWAAGWIAHLATSALVGSAHLVTCPAVVVCTRALRRVSS
jgi:competence protein ComEC